MPVPEPLAGLRVQLEALAEDWTMESLAPLTSPTAKLVFDRCARELRLIMRQSEELPTQPLNPEPDGR